MRIAAQSGIQSSIKEEGLILQGSPAFDVGAYRRSYIVFRHLNEWNTKIDKLEKEIQNLKKSSKA